MEKSIKFSKDELILIAIFFIVSSFILMTKFPTLGTWTTISGIIALFLIALLVKKEVKIKYSTYEKLVLGLFFLGMVIVLALRGYNIEYGMAGGLLMLLSVTLALILHIKASPSGL